MGNWETGGTGRVGLRRADARCAGTVDAGDDFEVEVKEVLSPKKASESLLLIFLDDLRCRFSYSMKRFR